MNKTSRVLTITAALMLSLSVNNFASAKTPEDFSVAVVDVQTIVENSQQINALKADHKNQIADLMKFVEKAKADVAKETNDDKKKSIEASYNKELNLKKQAIDKDYAKKLAEIDKSLTETIKAKSAGYDLVLVKTDVVKGGVDITSEIIKDLK